MVIKFFSYIFLGLFQSMNKQYLWSNESVSINLNRYLAFTFLHLNLLVWVVFGGFGLLVFFFLDVRGACGILVPRPGIETGFSVNVQSPTHWATREFPSLN